MILTKNLFGKNLQIRSVTVEDAKFILDLRLDPSLNKFLNQTSPSLEAQKKWISNQIIRDNDYYFLLQDHLDNQLGTGGIYDIEDGVFNCGRWLIKKNMSPAIAVESIILSYNFAFHELNLNIANFEVRKDNKTVINFHLSYGARIYKETEMDLLLEFSKEDFGKMLIKFQNFHIINIQ